MKTNKFEKSGHRVPLANGEKRNGESKQWRKAKRKVNNFRTKSKGGTGRKQRGSNSQESSGGVMDAIRSLYFFSHVNRLKTDSIVFRLHGLTAVLLLIFSITISTRQAVGNPIDCDHTREIPVNVFNAFCWVHSTYFVTAAMLGLSGINVAYPGVGPSRHHHPQGEHPSVVKHVKYYQWVAFTLFFQRSLGVWFSTTNIRGIDRRMTMALETIVALLFARNFKQYAMAEKLLRTRHDSEIDVTPVAINCQ